MIPLLFLAISFALELIVLSSLLDGSSLFEHSAFAVRILGAWGRTFINFLVSLAAATAAFTYLKRRRAVDAFLADVRQEHFNARALTLHLALFVSLLTLGLHLYASGARQGEERTDGLILPFLALASAVLLSGVAVVQPLNRWFRLIRSVGSVWVYAVAVALAAVLTTATWRALWRPASVLTYWLVQQILRPIVGHLAVDPSRMKLATTRFSVIIAPECSGLEGMGMLLLFGAVWLWLFRKECRFPHALLLLPAGLVTLFLLNSVRIAMLIMIGHAGARKMALEGFHSQAGWIAFNGVSFAFCVAARRLPWIAESRADEPAQPADVNVVAVWIGPLLAVLAAAMLSRSMTGNFEWLYSLRIPATCAMFWLYRQQYVRMDWRFTWYGPALGLLVFGVWMSLEWAISGSPSRAEPAALESASVAVRGWWTATRLIGAILIVPLAEELAFRGYLMRRLMTEEFDRLKPDRYTIWAVAGSSVLFGAMHGSHWLAGTLAGLIYAFAYARKGQLADAIVAHAVTNGLIAVAVLGLGYWKLW